MVPLLNGLNQILFICNSVISNNDNYQMYSVSMEKSVEIMCVDICLNSSTIKTMRRKKKSNCNYVLKSV